MAKDKKVWLSSNGTSWHSRVTAVEDGWLIELTNKSTFAASFFPQRLYANVLRSVPGGKLNPLLILLSDNTANPQESIIFKLSVTQEELVVLKGNRFRIAYGTGMGESSKELTVNLP